jgi:hypothetical protein
MNRRISSSSPPRTHELPKNCGLIPVRVDNLFNQCYNLVSDFLSLNSEEVPLTDFIRDRIPARWTFVFGGVNS